MKKEKGKAAKEKEEREREREEGERGEREREGRRESERCVRGWFVCVHGLGFSVGVWKWSFLNDYGVFLIIWSFFNDLVCESGVF